jgi:hypothetical protein
MKKTFLLSILLIFSILEGGEPKFEYILPNGVDYKIQPAGEEELHLFRLAKHPIDGDHWGLDLPSLFLMQLDEGEFKQSVDFFLGKSNEEIEEEVRSDNDSLLIHSVKYSKVKMGNCTGHRIQIDTEVSAVGQTKKFTVVNSYLKINETYWTANGMSLRGDEDIKTVDEILRSITITEQSEAQP